MNTTIKYAQLYLRLVLGIGFIMPVLDRLGLAGAVGQPNVAWGNWSNFVNYTGTLLPFLGKSLVNASAIIATVLEILFGICLIIGFKTRTMAIGSFALTVVFGLSMSLFLGLRAPINYSVFPVSAGSLLLSTIAVYNWSIDQYLTKRRGRF